MTRTQLLVMGLPLMVACARDGRPGANQPPAPQPVANEHSSMQGHPVGVPNGPPTAYVDPGARDMRAIREAVAVLSPASGSQVRGTVLFSEVENGVELFARVEGLPNGSLHAYHVHVYGDCSSTDAKSAGPHFHFTGSSMDQSVKIITGNLGELAAQHGQPVAEHRVKIADATLQGPFSIVGRAVVVHAKGNDPTKTPDGGAGDRIACGVIGIANPEMTGEMGRPPVTTRR